MSSETRKYSDERIRRLTGLSHNGLRVYIESLFTEGMSWDNYGIGGWEIDHINACKNFNLTNEKELKTCFYYTNLRPLWAS
jgi:hypothetical protein